MERKELYAAWIEAKAAEVEAIERRRAIEDALAEELAIDPELDGTVSGEEYGFKVKIVGRLNHKVDGQAVMKLPEKIQVELFRWKPELNVAAWKKADAETSALVANCITTSAGRPSITVEKVEE